MRSAWDAFVRLMQKGWGIAAARYAMILVVALIAYGVVLLLAGKDPIRRTPTRSPSP